MTTILETRHLFKYFKSSGGYVHAVDDISMHVEESKTLGIVGESGCGKSTLGRTVIGLHHADSGDVYFQGQEISRMKEQEFKHLRGNMQIIMQDPFSSLNPRMNVCNIIADPLKVNHRVGSKAELNQQVKELMDTVGLARRYIYSYPHELDGGRRQRVAIARAIALKPKLIVCDEPVSALDVSIQAQTLNLLMDLQEELNLTYLFISHNLSVVKHISHDIMVMYLGQVIERASSDELFARPLHPYTQALLKAIPVPDYYYYQNEETEVLAGEVSDAIDPPPGCRFAPRCPKATDCCYQKAIPLKTVAPGHEVACILCQSCDNG